MIALEGESLDFAVRTRFSEGSIAMADPSTENTTHPAKNFIQVILHSIFQCGGRSYGANRFLDNSNLVNLHGWSMIRRDVLRRQVSKTVSFNLQ
jgi:hypothetical protein